MPAIRNALEGKPLRSPLHPALVHLPIALFPLSVLLDVGSHFCPCNELYLVRGAYYLLLAGIGLGLVAAFFGLVDYTDIRRDHPAKKTATWHAILNVTAVGLFAGSAWWRHDRLDATSTAWGPLLLSVVALAVIGYSGYLGGHLVYSDGIGVGRHRRRTRTPDATVTAGTADQSWVAVGQAAALATGETLRAEIRGQVIAVARIGTRFYAFQEFCTHRYGPLSEGKITDCQVTCPWHRSVFDLRTGKVVSGPAELDLPTFRTEVRDGQILVEIPVTGAAARR